MKAKGISICAALLTGLLFLNDPLFAAVESDIVGYTTITMEAGKWYQVGVPFEQLNGATSYNISEVFSKGFSDGDMLFVMDPTTCAYPVVRKWRTVNGTSGWGKVAIPKLEDATIDAGEAVLINKKTTGDVTFIGKVNSLAKSVISGDNAWSLVALQYPTEVAINSLKWSGIENNDMLFVMDPELCTYITVRKWRTVNGTSGWGKVAIPKLEDLTLTPGQAVLINKKSSGTATVSFE